MTKQVYSYRIIKNSKWQDKRKRIFERDNYICQRCGNHTGKPILHHISYESGLLPWDYPDEYFITLCPHCHAAEHNKLSVETDTGWQLVDFWDSKEYGSETCDYCGADLRYVYVLYHPKLKTFINVGETCADKLQEAKEIVESAKKFNKFLLRFCKVNTHYGEVELIVYKRILFLLTSSIRYVLYADFDKITKKQKAINNIAFEKLNIFNNINNGTIEDFIYTKTNLYGSDKLCRKRLLHYIGLQEGEYTEDCILKK